MIRLSALLLKRLESPVHYEQARTVEICQSLLLQLTETFIAAVFLDCISYIHDLFEKRHTIAAGRMASDSP
jgi:hypothetical protein